MQKSQQRNASAKSFNAKIQALGYMLEEVNLDAFFLG
jgi:hypothetical protein